MDTPSRPHVRAPRLGGGPWFNGAPLAGWLGGVTLVDFWTYSCVNCLRTLPALRAWHERYAALGLAVVGVHTPEFPFERDPANVARALRELDVPYRVVLDNDRAIWSAFANRYWPHRYLIDPTGRIVHDYAGEGGERGTESAIRALLAARGVALPPPVFSSDGAEDEALMGAVCVPATPELFAGYYRGVAGNPGGFVEDRDADYADPGGYREGYIHLHGRWHVGADAARFVGPGMGYLRVAFRGRSPNVVLAPPDRGQAEVGVHVAALATVDAVPGTSTELLAVAAPRFYALPGAPGVALGEPLLLTLAFDTPGAAVYSFTFESCPPGQG